MDISAILSGAGLSLGALTLSAALKALLLLVIGLAAIRIVLNLTGRLLERSHALAPLAKTARSVLKVLLYILLLLVILGSLGVEVTSLIAILSVVSLSVSLALQNTLSNVAGGIMILVSKPFSAGDYVGIGDVEGTVETIGLSYSTLVTMDNKQIFLPNSQLSGAQIVNYNRLGKRRIDLTFTASYAAPTAAVRRAIEEAVAAFPQVLSAPAPVVYVADYGSSAISYSMRAWVKSDDYWDVRFGIIEEVRNTFKKHNVEMTYNHLNVHVVRDEPAARS